MKKMLSAQINMSQRKERSLHAELPRVSKKLRIADGPELSVPEGEASGDGLGATGGPDTRASWTLGFTTYYPKLIFLIQH
jgi:hypothetical protein